ncbi:hypothetical protein NPIL_368211 [Nephila pilipes]|uniref:Uncharacterized protein n=1 Tax=Nephila pilipes TaxID=299642 RepID=A0A8X6QY69_NEPPI|nr:hypothetical protein NPIL_368211 [Nephila pilipes]
MYAKSEKVSKNRREKNLPPRRQWLLWDESSQSSSNFSPLYPQGKKVEGVTNVRPFGSGYFVPSQVMLYSLESESGRRLMRSGSGRLLFRKEEEWMSLLSGCKFGPALSAKVLMEVLNSFTVAGKSRFEIKILRLESFVKQSTTPKETEMLPKTF